jgi:hypothetical protein
VFGDFLTHAVHGVLRADTESLQEARGVLDGVVAIARRGGGRGTEEASRPVVHPAAPGPRLNGGAPHADPRLATHDPGEHVQEAGG